MAANRVLATFGTKNRAEAARAALLAAGYRTDAVEVDDDMTAELVPFEDARHPSAANSSSTPDGIRFATPNVHDIAAKRMAGVRRRNGAALTLTINDQIELATALRVLWQHDPTAVRRLGA